MFCALASLGAGIATPGDRSFRFSEFFVEGWNVSDHGDEMWDAEDYPPLTWRDRLDFLWFKVRRLFNMRPMRQGG